MGRLRQSYRQCGLRGVFDWILPIFTSRCRNCKSHPVSQLLRCKSSCILLQNQMDESLHLFEKITKLEELRSVPIMVLINKWDLFKQRILDTPISDTFPNLCRSMGAVTACNFFADEYVKRDERPNGSLRIF
jgi:hypothetical protein